MPTVFVDNPVWVNQWKPSLVVTVGNGPAYNPATDVSIFRKTQRQFFVTQEVVVVQRTWQTSPVGAVGFNIDPRQWATNFRLFNETNPPWINEWKPTPRTTTDFIQSSDIFAGHDTFGWPENPEPPKWVNEMRGTFNALQNFVPYNPAPDMFLRKKMDVFFAPEQVVWTPQQPLPQSLVPYVPYLDTLQQPQAKFFADQPIFVDFSQRPNIQTITIFPTYNPATDVTRRVPQAKWFDPQALWWDSAWKVTVNAITFIPTPYNPATDPNRLLRQARFDAVVDPVFDHPQIPARVVWDVTQVIPPVTPTITVSGQGRVVLNPKKIGEQVFVPMDFISRLGIGEAITSAFVTCTVYSGTDPNPSAMLIGSASISGSIVQQEVAAGVQGVVYDLLFTALTNLNQRLELAGYYAVVPDLP